MKMLQNMYVIWSEYQRAEVVKWVKQQIAQNYFNCTVMPSSDSRLCKKLVKIVNKKKTHFLLVETKER